MPGCDVEEFVGREALPGHHVQDGGLAPAEPAGVGESPRPENFNSKIGLAVDSLGGKIPLILEPTGSIAVFEGGDSHDEVVLECLRND